MKKHLPCFLCVLSKLLIFRRTCKIPVSSQTEVFAVIPASFIPILSAVAAAAALALRPCAASLWDRIHSKQLRVSSLKEKEFSSLVGAAALLLWISKQLAGPFASHSASAVSKHPLTSWTVEYILTVLDKKTASLCKLNQTARVFSQKLLRSSPLKC